MYEWDRTNSYDLATNCEIVIVSIKNKRWLRVWEHWVQMGTMILILMVMQLNSLVLIGTLSSKKIENLCSNKHK